MATKQRKKVAKKKKNKEKSFAAVLGDFFSFHREAPVHFDVDTMELKFRDGDEWDEDRTKKIEKRYVAVIVYYDPRFSDPANAEMVQAHSTTSLANLIEQELDSTVSGDDDDYESADLIVYDFVGKKDLPARYIRRHSVTVGD